MAEVISYLEAARRYWLSSPDAPRWSLEQFTDNLAFAYGTLGLRPSLVFARYSRILLEQDSEEIIQHLRSSGKL